jgi:predicted aspartyl protease
MELENFDDVVEAKRGHIRPEQVRRTRIRGVVDSGASRLVIPEEVARRLGLEISGTAKVHYADGRTEERPIARDIRLNYGGREGLFSAIVEPDRDSALIGAIVMEELDFLIDCELQELVPRDPKQIASEAESVGAHHFSPKYAAFTRGSAASWSERPSITIEPVSRT